MEKEATDLSSLVHKTGQRGFTMAELLVVVAIIAVLVAVAIPVFSAQLEKSREAVDLANVRSAYAVLQIAKNEETLPDGTKDFNASPPKAYFFSESSESCGSYTYLELR